MADFSPFAFDEHTVRRQLEHAVRDRYWAFHVGGQLAGFFMLRGFDAGYERPSFGVFVAEKYRGHGLATAALAYAKRWCKEHNVHRIMLKVAASNRAARSIYEKAGFVSVGPCPDTGHLIHEWRSAA